MFCKNCGAELADNASFCSNCGTAVISSQSDQQQNSTGLVGFSSKINDPAFAAYKKKSAIWTFIFTGILAIIAIVGFPIYGNMSGEVDWPGSLLYGFAIGGMFIVIALLQTLKKGLDKTWDGEVVSKDAYTVRERNNNGQTHYHKTYVLKIKKDSGGTKKHKWRDTTGLYTYYNVGDRVRHHKGFYCYEKYDKSKDTHILCAACMAFVPVDQDKCSRCKCPVLK